MTLLISLVALAAAPPSGSAYVEVRNAGTSLGVARALDCGSNMTCSVSGGVATLSSSGGGGGGAPTTATYITQTPNAGLSAEQAMSALGSGLVVNTTATGVQSIYAGATCGANQYATATSASGALTCSQVATSQLSGTITNAQLASSYSGVGTCTNQFARVLNANAAPTCATVTSADVSLTTTGCTNQFVTAISAGGVGTCTTDTLASAQHANQGTTTTVLHGNAAGNPSWGAVSLTADVTGTLAQASGGTGAGALTCSAGDFITSNGTTYSCATPSGGGGGGTSPLSLLLGTP